MSAHEKNMPSAKGGTVKATKYQAEFCEIAGKICQAGATDKELAKSLGIHRSTLYRWLAEHPELREAVQAGKSVADERVLRSFYQCCVGYEYEAVKVMQHDGRPVVVRYMERVLPDPSACFTWLKNRRPGEWRDRREVVVTTVAGLENKG
jgi:Homeodomain-like domain